MSEMCQLEALSEASAIVSVMDYHASKSCFPVAFIKLTKQVCFLSLNLRCLLYLMMDSNCAFIGCNMKYGYILHF